MLKINCTATTAAYSNNCLASRDAPDTRHETQYDRHNTSAASGVRAAQEHSVVCSWSCERLNWPFRGQNYDKWRLISTAGMRTELMFFSVLLL